VANPPASKVAIFEVRRNAGTSTGQVPMKVVHIEGAALCGKPDLARPRPPPPILVERQSFKPSARPLSVISLAPMQAAHLGYGERTLCGGRY
jgi:hypothetical protein